jgi:hypothetical protein
MRLLHRPTQPNKVLPTAHSQWERDELEASAARISSQFLQANTRATKVSPIERDELETEYELEKEAQPATVLSSAPIRGRKRAGRKAMRSLFKEANSSTLMPNPQVGEISSLRARILSLSLFPNLHNRSYLMKEGSTSS